MAFPLDPKTLRARNYFPFLQNGSYFKAEDIDLDTPIGGMQQTYSLTASGVTGLVPGQVITFTNIAGQGTVAGDIIELNPAGNCRTAQLNSTTAIGVAVTGGTVSTLVRVGGLAQFTASATSASLVVGQYAIMGSASNTIAGAAVTTASFGRILNSSASFGTATVLLSNA